MALPQPSAPLLCPECGSDDVYELSEVTATGNVLGVGPDGETIWGGYETHDDFARTGDFHCRDCESDFSYNETARKAIFKTWQEAQMRERSKE